MQSISLSLKLFLAQFFICLLFSPITSYAEWKSFVVFNDGQAHFYDKSSVKRNGEKIRVWEYVNFSTDNKEEKYTDMVSSRQLEEIDCVNETSKTLSLHSFTKLDLRGDMKDYTNPDPTIHYIVPNSAMSALMQLVCKK